MGEAEIADREARDAGSRRWRSVWRLHFYAGIFAIPFIFLMASSGLVILYTQPIQDATQGDIRRVSDRGDWTSFDAQEQAVEAAYPDVPVVSMTMPADGGHATIFAIDDGSEAGRQVFVDPYTADVLGTAKPGGGIVGLANRLHGFLDNDRITVSLPAVSALWDGDAVMRDYVVGDLVLETLGVWTLALILSGLYLWWPRRSGQAAAAAGARRGFFSVRLRKKGRARWRDLHGIAGVLAFVLLAVTLVSGLAWSTYWGPSFTALANEITPNSWTDAPASALGERSDLDRLGNTIPWNTGDRPIPASYAPERTDGTGPAPLRLDDVVAIAQVEGMKPGYTVHFPTNTVDDAGNALPGSFTLSNSWPRKTGEGRDLFLDQYSGATLAEQTAFGYGAISHGLDTTVSFHMGTQLGVVNRILMTGMCLLAMWSAFSAGVMFWKRRRPGTLGLPRRPADVHLGRRLTVLGVLFGIVFPQWAVSALIVLGLDRFVIRRMRPLRVTFGQR